MVNSGSLDTYKPLRGKSYAMPVIHKDYLDVRDLAQQMREAAEEFEEQDFAAAEDKEDVVETLKAFYNLATELRNGATYFYDSTFDPADEDFVEDMKATAIEIENFQNEHSPTLVSEDSFVDSIQEYVEDAYGLSEMKIPHFLSIDWNQTAENLRPNYFEVVLDGKTYLAEK